MKFVSSRNIFEESKNIKSHENSSSGEPIVPCGRTERQTDMKLKSRFSLFCERAQEVMTAFCFQGANTGS